MQINEETVERNLVRVAEKLGKKKGMNNSEVARRAFGDKGSSITRWRKMRNQNQRLRLADAMKIAKALDVPLDYLLHVTALAMRFRAESLSPPILLEEDDQSAT